MVGSELDLRGRGDRLKSLVGRAKIDESFNLLQVLRIPEVPFRKLQSSVRMYLWESLSAVGTDVYYELTENILDKYADEILSLPNRTPNGVLLPRLETQCSFNIVQKNLSAIMQSMGLVEGFSTIQAPVNVRIVSGEKDSRSESRSYASTKVHTDLWNGEPLAAVLFNLCVLGDVENIGIEFYEPRSFPKDMVRGLSDYSEGDTVVQESELCPVEFRIGSLYLSDSCSLHRTCKKGNGIRLSLDFRAMPAKLISSETSSTQQSKALYLQASLWREIGASVLVATGKDIHYFERQKSSKPLTPEHIRLVEIDELD